MSDETYKVTGAAAFVVRSNGPGGLVYQGGPVPSDAVNLETLLASGTVGKVEKDDYAGGHPSDLRPGHEAEVELPDDKKTAAPAKKTAAPKPS